MNKCASFSSVAAEVHREERVVCPYPIYTLCLFHTPQCGGYSRHTLSHMCEQTDTAQSRGDDARPGGSDHTQSVIDFVGSLRAWLIDRCSNKDAGKREHETPTDDDTECDPESQSQWRRFLTQDSLASRSEKYTERQHEQYRSCGVACFRGRRHVKKQFQHHVRGK